jgi:IS5 family transposase
MSAPDFFRSRLDQKIDLHHPSAVLASRLPWTAIEASLARSLARQERTAKRVICQDLLGVTELEFGAGMSPARRPRLSVRLLVRLMYLKSSMNFSDEDRRGA